MKRLNSGISLIELLVTLVVALILLAGVGKIFVNSKQGYRVQESTSRLQENARITVDYLSRYIRLADLWGGVKASEITVANTTYAGPGGCSDTWIVDPTSGLVGYQGGATSPLPAGCIAPASDYVPNTDIIALRYANPDAYVSTATLQAGGTSLTANGNYYVRSYVGKRAILFDASAPANITGPVSTIPGDGDSGVLNYQFQNVVFYIENVNSIPTFSMLRLQSSGLASDPLVDGIEALAFEYGIDTNNDLLVDTYVEAPAVTDWAQVLSVRASFIARGDAIDTFTDTQTYQLTATRCHGPASSGCASTYSSAESRFQRRLVVKEIQLRNRVRG